MRTGFDQTRALLTVTTPLGTDALLLDELQASEGLSELFELNLRMRSSTAGLAASSIIGKSVTVELAVADGPKRYFNGIASRFVHTGSDVHFAHYTCVVVPKTWLLGLSRNRAIWQTKTVPEIVKDVLGKAGVTIKDALTASYKALDYVVQFDETDLDFISRLMEDAGIFYWFTHTSSGHTMVLADASSAHTDCSDAKAIRYLPDTGSLHAMDTIAALHTDARLVSKTHVVDTIDLTTPATSLRATQAGSAGSGERYAWGTSQTDASGGTSLAKRWMEAAAVDANTVHGHGYAYPFLPGTKFSLTEHPIAALNTSYVLRRVQHTASHDEYRNSFEAFAATTPFKAPLLTPRPRVAGSQTAEVVGPQGEEIWCDKHGRIKVKFHWDRVGQSDDTASCWVPVAQSIAGKGFGTLFLPRIGQEVVISCIDGNPDRPLVTGCVYTGTNTPPVTLPANQTQSVIRTRSSKNGSAGNEIRFEDKKDAEELYLHAQKDMKVEVENDQTTTLTEGSQTLTIEKGDRTIAVKTGNETHTVEGTRAVEVTGDETHDSKADFTHDVGGAFTLKVTGDLTIDVTGAITIKSGKGVTLKAATTLLAEAGTSLTNKAGTALTNKAGTALTNEGTTGLTNKSAAGLVNQAGTTLDNKGLMINSKSSAMQTIDGGGMLTVKGGLVKVN